MSVRTDTPGIRPMSELEAVYPLTPMQEGMLFHSVYASDPETYFNQYTFTLRGPLDQDALCRAWQAVVNRHPVLRTAFAWEKVDTPLQAVRRSAQLPFRSLDWRETPRGELRARLDDFLRADRALGFSLSAAPLLRVALIRTGDAQHEMVWSHHHLLLDAWSGPLVLRDVFAAYAAFAAGGSFDRPTPRPFSDFAAWVRQQDAAAGERYWRAALAGFRAPTPLPLGRGGADASTAAPVESKAALSAEETARLRSFARQHGLTLGTLVHGAWSILLSRYAATDDVVFGTTVSGRPSELEGVEEMVGLFINTLALRVRVDAGAGLVPWLAALQVAQSAGRAYETTALADVQRWSELEPGEPLFETLVVINGQSDDAGAGEVGRLSVERTGAFEKTNYPILLEARAEGRLALRLYHAPARLEAGAGARLLDQLASLLREVGRNPARAIGELPLLGDAEREQVLSGWNHAVSASTDAPAPLLHAAIAARAARTPDASAVVSSTLTLSFAELDRRANRLAHHLRARGVGLETRVGVCLDRTTDWVVAVLGVLKVGAVYVPLDPRYPAERLAYMLADCGASVVLTHSSVAHVVTAFAGETIRLDTAGGPISRESDADPAVEVPAAAAAYVIYTSGSTGRPKGVVVPHGGLASLARAQERGLGVGEGSRVFQFSPISFDASMWELAMTLPVGAALHLPNPGTVPAGTELAQALRRDAITTVTLPPSALATVPEGPLPALATLVLAGEACGAEVVRRWAGGRCFLNAYGPTEATVCVTWATLTPETAGAAPPIGRPLEGARAYVLDRSGSPVPAGVRGELYAGGAGVARGYLGRPGLTAEHFVPDPFGEPGARLYRTGDRVRWTTEGELEFVGRLDGQVKLRGFRIEPGEVENVLREQPGVMDAAVVVREDAPGERRLVAYVVPASASTAELRAALERRLPAYLVPAAFVAMDAFPATPNGKVDRAALPVPGAAVGAASHHDRPGTPMEALLCGIFGEVLRVERAGLHDSFFELGGDSILSLQVVSRARRAGVRLTPQQIFEHPTPARLAPHLAAWDGPGAAAGPVEGDVALLPVQRWFLELGFPAPGHFNQSVLLVPRAPLDADALGRALDAVAAHHDALRLRLRREGDEWRQAYVTAEPVPLQVIELSGLDAATRAATLARAAEAVQGGMDPERGPVLGAALLAGGPDSGRLLLAAHHLVVDAVSWRILLEDLETAYRQAARGEAIELPEPTTSLQEWGRLLEEHAASPALAQEAAFWLAGARADAPALPLDDATAPDISSEAEQVLAGLTEDETEVLLRDVPAAYRTRVDDVLLTALARALVRWAGGSRVRVDVESHGRGESRFPGADLSRTVGWLTSLYPFVPELPTGGPGEALRAVKEQLRAVPGRGLGYGLLRHLGPDGVRDALAAAPRAGVVFNYLGQYDGAITAGAFFAFAPESFGPESAGENPRPHPLEVTAAVREGRLELVLGYGARVLRRDTAQRLTAWIVEELRAVIDHCVHPDAGGHTPSDFPLVELDAETLALLEADFAFAGAE